MLAESRSVASKLSARYQHAIPTPSARARACSSAGRKSRCRSDPHQLRSQTVAGLAVRTENPIRRDARAGVWLCLLKT